MNINQMKMMNMNPMPAMNMNSMPAMNMNSMPAMNMNPMPAMNMNSMPAMKMNSMPVMNQNLMPAMNMNPMEMINKINALSVKNKSLENKLQDLEKKFEDYQKKMESILFYNEIDPNSYTLDSVFDNLPSNRIIKNKEEIRLINKGIKNLFNKNIICFECKYQTKAENFNLSHFKQIFNNINYALIAIATKHGGQRFGAFRIYNDPNGINPMNIMGMNNNQMMGDNQINDNIDLMMNNMNIMNQEVNIIFDSKSSLNNSFIFSLDNMNIFYKMNYTPIDSIPNFNLIYNEKHESLFVNFFPINSSPFNQFDDTEQNNINLPGSQELKVKYLELYEILI